MPDKPLILISNDDGIFAPGLYALYKVMKKIGEVKVIAPETEQSAVGHSITLRNPLRAFTWYRFGKPFGTAISGTPADCVKFALAEMLDRKPDLVVSGINQGTNTGVDIMYSGTVSGATEAAINHIPAIAISLASFVYSNFEPAAQFAHQIALKTLKNGLPVGTFLNVNIPPFEAEEIKGVKWTRQGLSRWEEHFERRMDPKGKPYYWLNGDKVCDFKNGNTDEKCIEDGCISITPVHIDFTDHEFLNNGRKWNFNTYPLQKEAVAS